MAPGRAPAGQTLDDVVRLLHAVLGADLVGGYLFGSAMLGGLRPASDLDVLVVTRRSSSAAQRRELVAGLLAISGSRAARGPARPVELTVVVRSDVVPWRYPPRSDFQYGEWLREDYERGVVPQPAPSPDLAILITKVLLVGRAVLGPPAADVLVAVPARDLDRAVVAGLPELFADLDTDTTNVVLTLTRAWATLASGGIVSKDAAADWALPRLPPEHRPVLAHARASYLGDEQASWDGRLLEVRAHAEHVLALVSAVHSP